MFLLPGRRLTVKLAAVLVPLLGDPPDRVLLTRRAVHLSAHPDQVSFPGGRIDALDANPEAAALREAWEEIGLDSADVEIIGHLPQRDTSTGYLVTPVVGRVREGAVLSPAPGEVAEIFSLPLAVVLDPAAPERRRIRLANAGSAGEDIWREFWVWPHLTQYIWGATAAILVDLAEWLTAR